MTKSIRAVAYYRKSNEDDGSSIEQQRGWAETACPREGIHIERDFADQAKKGWDTANRTAFHEMLGYCQEQHRRGTPIDAIVCWHANRFSRADSQETAWYIWEFRKVGVGKMFTASGWTDYSRMEDRVLSGIVQDTSSHRFSLDLAQSSMRGRISAAREGRPLGGRNYGYEKEYEEVAVPGKGKRRRPKRLVPGDPAEVDVVRWLFRSYATTVTSTRRLAADLNRRAVRPPKRAPGWGHQAIASILTNPVYIGVVPYGKNGSGKFFRVVDGQARPAAATRAVPNDPSTWIIGDRKHEPLIDQATFDEVQRRLTQRKKNSSPRGENAPPLSGLMTCGCCEHSMVSRLKRHRSSKEGDLRQYICLGYNIYGSQVCGQNTISEDLLMGVVLRKLQELFVCPQSRQRLRLEIRAQLTEGQGDDAAVAERLKSEIGALDEKIQKAARRLLTEDESLLPLLRQQVQEMQAEEQRLKSWLAALEGRNRAVDDFEARMDRAAALVGRLPELWHKAPPSILREVLAAMVSEIVLHFEHRHAHGRKRSRFTRGVIHLREDVSPEYIPGHGSLRLLPWRIMTTMRALSMSWTCKPVNSLMRKPQA